jgi:hypothetical protein
MIKLKELLEEVENDKYTIYCDLDGVLVDFEKGYEEASGKPMSAAGEGAEFWEPIHKMGASFWIKLKWLPDGHALWNYIKPYNPTLLSAPSQEESSRIGKRVWKKNNIPDAKMILTPAKFKQKYSGENKILIDDMEKNIQQWRDKGGIGILHTSAADTIKQLKELGL